MGRNLEKDAIEMAAKNQRILESGFRIFAEKGIEKVTMNDIAEAAEIGIASLYRYYPSKPAVVLAVGAWVWDEFSKENRKKQSELQTTDQTGAEMFDFYLESFLDLYREHKDLLRFNQFFNVYLQIEDVSNEQLKGYTDIIDAVEMRFAETYRKGKEDGTLRTDMSAEEMFSVTAHLMLAAVTRYAVGLVYTVDTDIEKELLLLKEMMINKFVIK